jgi:hypothetical protein
MTDEETFAVVIGVNKPAGDVISGRTANLSFRGMMLVLKEKFYSLLASP